MDHLCAVHTVNVHRDDENAYRAFPQGVKWLREVKVLEQSGSIELHELRSLRYSQSYKDPLRSAQEQTFDANIRALRMLKIAHGRFS